MRLSIPSVKMRPQMATAVSKGTEYVNIDRNHFVANKSIGT